MSGRTLKPIINYFDLRRKKGVLNLFYFICVEIEWAPEGLDLDFSAFNSSPYDSYSQTKEAKLDLDDYPVLTRRFTVDQKEKEEITTTTLIEAVQDIEHDTTRIEYGPPKEIEIPYLPNESCIVDFNAFNGYADPSAYESTRLYNKDKLEFSVFDDLDALAQLTDDTSLGNFLYSYIYIPFC